MAGDYKQKITVVFSGADKATKGAKKVEMSMGKLGKSIIGAGAAYFGARGLIEGIKQSVQLAGQQQALEKAFANLGKGIGITSQSIDKFSRAVDGTVSEVDLLKVANQAMTLGVVDSEEGMAELLDTAQRLGQSLGVDTLHAVDSLVTGMGRQSIMMLDNLGIIIDSEAAYDTYAASIDKTASELTDQEKKIAFNNAALESAKDKVAVLGDEQLTSADAVAQFNTAMTNVSTMFGEMFIPVLQDAMSIITPLIGEFQGFLETSGFIPTELDKINTEMTGQIVKVNMLFAELRKTNTEEERRKDIYVQLNNIYPELNLNLSKETSNKEDLAIAQEKLVTALKDERNLKLNTSAMKETEEQLAKTRGEFSAITSKYFTMLETMSEIPEVQNAVNKALRDARSTGRQVVDVYDLLPNELMEITAALDANKTSWMNGTAATNIAVGAIQDAGGTIGILATLLDASTDKVDGANGAFEMMAEAFEATVNDMSGDGETLAQLFLTITQLEQRLIAQRESNKRMTDSFNETLKKNNDTTDENKEKVEDNNTAYTEWVKTKEKLVRQSKEESDFMTLLSVDNKVLFDAIQALNNQTDDTTDTYESYRKKTKELMEEKTKEAGWLEDFLKEFPQYRDELDKSVTAIDNVIDTQAEFNEAQQENLDKMQLEQDFIDAYVKEFGQEKADMLGLVTSEQIAENDAKEKKLKQDRENEANLRKEIKLLQTKRDMTKSVGTAVIDLIGINEKNAKHVANLQALQSVVDAFFAAQVAFKQAASNPTTILNPLYPKIVYGMTLGTGLAQAAAVRAQAAAEGMDELVTEPTLILAGEEGPEYVDIEPTLNEGEGRNKGVNITFSGNVLSQDFIEDEALPLIRDALRKGGDIGLS